MVSSIPSGPSGSIETSFPAALGVAGKFCKKGNSVVDDQIMSKQSSNNNFSSPSQLDP